MVSLFTFCILQKREKTEREGREEGGSRRTLVNNDAARGLNHGSDCLLQADTQQIWSVSKDL